MKSSGPQPLSMANLTVFSVFRCQGSVEAVSLAAKQEKYSVGENPQESEAPVSLTQVVCVRLPLTTGSHLGRN